MPKQRTQLESALYWLKVNREWVDRCGGNAAGYQLNYADAVACGQYTVEDVQAIYDADIATCRRYESMVSMLTSKLRK